MLRRLSLLTLAGLQLIACREHVQPSASVPTHTHVTVAPLHALTQTMTTIRHTTELFKAATQQPLDVVVFLDDSPFIRERLPTLVRSWRRAFSLPERQGWDIDMTVFAKANTAFADIVAALPTSSRVKIIPYDDANLTLLMAQYATGHHRDAQPRHDAAHEWLVVTDRDFSIDESWGQSVSWHVLAGQVTGHDAEFSRCFVRERATKLMALQEQSGGMFFDLCTAETVDWAQQFVSFLQQRQGSYQLQHQPDSTQVVEVSVDGEKVNSSFWHLEAKERRLSFHPGFGLPASARVSVRYGYTDAATMAVDASVTNNKH